MENISTRKARIIAHALADGSVYPPHMLNYYNNSRALHKKLREDIEKVYGIKPSSYAKFFSKTLASTWYSKEMISDLLRYTPTYSTSSREQGTCIPSEVVNGSIVVKREFLRAYMTDDGYVTLARMKRKSSRSNSERISNETSVVACSENKEILKMLRKLFLGFSIEPRVFKKKMVIRSIEDVVRFYLSVGFQSGGKCSKSKNHANLTKNEMLEFALRHDDRLNGRKRVWRVSNLVARVMLINSGRGSMLSPLEGLPVSAKMYILFEKGFFDVSRSAQEIVGELKARGLGTYKRKTVLDKLFKNFVRPGMLRCTGNHARQLFQRSWRQSN